MRRRRLPQRGAAGRAGGSNELPRLGYANIVGDIAPDYKNTDIMDSQFNLSLYLCQQT